MRKVYLILFFIFLTVMISGEQRGLTFKESKIYLDVDNLEEYNIIDKKSEFVILDKYEVVDDDLEMLTYYQIDINGTNYWINTLDVIKIFVVDGSSYWGTIENHRVITEDRGNEKYQYRLQEVFLALYQDDKIYKIPLHSLSEDKGKAMSVEVNELTLVDLLEKRKTVKISGIRRYKTYYEGGESFDIEYINFEDGRFNSIFRFSELYMSYEPYWASHYIKGNDIYKVEVIINYDWENMYKPKNGYYKTTKYSFNGNIYEYVKEEKSEVYYPYANNNELHLYDDYTYDSNYSKIKFDEVLPITRILFKDDKFDSISNLWLEVNIRNNPGLSYIPISDLLLLKDQK